MPGEPFYSIFGVPFLVRGVKNLERLGATRSPVDRSQPVNASQSPRKLVVPFPMRITSNFRREDEQRDHSMWPHRTMIVAEADKYANFIDIGDAE